MYILYAAFVRFYYQILFTYWTTNVVSQKLKKKKLLARKGVTSYS